MPLSADRLPAAYRQMLVIRKFEEAIRVLYEQGRIRGSFHPCVGQEASALGVGWALRPDDYLTCTYRGHGQALAKGLNVRAAFAEMLGKATGCSKGKGGSMHFTDPSVGLLGANAIVAGGGPTYLELNTYRLWGHMMGDPQVYRTKAEVAQAWQVEPIVRLGARLQQLGHTDADLSRLAAEADAIIADAQQFAEASPAPEPADALADLFA